MIQSLLLYLSSVVWSHVVLHVVTHHVVVVFFLVSSSVCISRNNTNGVSEEECNPSVDQTTPEEVHFLVDCVGEHSVFVSEDDELLLIETPEVSDVPCDLETEGNFGEDES